MGAGRLQEPDTRVQQIQVQPLRTRSSITQNEEALDEPGEELNGCPSFGPKRASTTYTRLLDFNLVPGLLCYVQRVLITVYRYFVPL